MMIITWAIPEGGVATPCVVHFETHFGTSSHVAIVARYTEAGSRQRLKPAISATMATTQPTPPTNPAAAPAAGPIIPVSCPRCRTNLMAGVGSWSMCPSCQFQFFTPASGPGQPPAGASPPAPGQQPGPVPPTSQPVSGVPPPRLPPGGPGAPGGPQVMIPAGMPRPPLPGMMPMMAPLPGMVSLPGMVPGSMVGAAPGTIPSMPVPTGTPLLAPALNLKSASAPIIPPVRGDGDMSSAVEAAAARQKQALADEARDAKKWRDAQAKGEVHAGPSMKPYGSAPVPPASAPPIEEPPAKV